MYMKPNGSTHATHKCLYYTENKYCFRTFVHIYRLTVSHERTNRATFKR